MRDRSRFKPRPTPQLDWPGGVVPEWARPPQSANRRHGKGKGPGGGAGAGKRERLQKVMAQSGHGSRRNIEILIAQGHLTINGQVAKLGDLVGPGDRVKLDGAPIQLRFGEQMPRVMLYHKPEGEIVTRDDPQGRATVFEKLPRVNGGRWVSVGRLDLNTGGLLIFTTNGELANRLTHPSFEVEREYAVRLLGPLTDEARGKLLAGVDIEGESCKFDSIEDRGGEGANHWVHVILREGKNREVRRMFEAVGVTVSRLMRVRFGSVQLPSFVKRGQMREMPEDEVAELLAFAGMGEESKEDAEAREEEDEDESIGNRAPAGAQPAPAEYEIEDDDWQPDWSRIPDPNRPPGQHPQPGARAQPGAGGNRPGGGGQHKKGGQRRKKGGQGQGGQQHKQGGQQARQPGQPGGGQPGGGPPKAGVPGGKPGGHRGKRHRNRRGKGRGPGPGPLPGDGQPQQRGEEQQPLSNENRRPN